MKKYLVIWRNIGEEHGPVVFATNDVKMAYEYTKNRLPYGKEALLYNDNTLEFKCIKA